MLQNHNIDSIRIIKRKNEHLLELRGWAIVPDETYKLIICYNQKQIEYELNEKREDVTQAFKLDNKHNLGFNYQIGIEDNSFIEVKIGQPKGNIITIFSAHERDLLQDGKEKNTQAHLMFNIEKVNMFKEDEEVYIHIMGWVFNQEIDTCEKIKICTDSGDILYDYSTQIRREDVQKAYKNFDIPIETGFDILVKLDSKVEYINIIFYDEDGELVARKIEIPEYIKVNEEYIKERIELIKKEYKKKLLKNIWRINKHKKIKEECIYTLEKEEERLRELIECRIEEITPYESWVKNNTLTEEILSQLKQEAMKFTYQPKISIVMPVWNVEQKWLDRAIETLKSQVYTNWELCIADDCSTKEYIRPYLAKLAEDDARIKICYREKNGNISAATNSAFELVTGEYILLMDNDDELEANALFEVVKVLQNSKADIIYSDDDKIDEKGNRYAPQFKPDWSPELLLSFMYFSHLFCMKTELYRKVGGCRVGFEGCQDYDLALRVSEISEQIIHIPKVLYHWRSLEGSTALDGNAKPEAFERGIRAVQEAIDRRGIKGKVNRPDFALKNHLGIFELEFSNEGPKVSIIIPTKNRKDLLKRCIDSIVERTEYKNYEIVVINNESDEKETLGYLESIRNKHTVLDIKNKDNIFSYAYINNQAVQSATGEYVLFLNNDTEVISPQWLTSMVGYMQFKDVGIVGARLLYPDKRVQHAGCVMGLFNGMVGHAFKLLPDYDLGYFNLAQVARNYSCVTAACLLISKQLFNDLGGFDEENFAVAYNDVDLCIRCTQLGKRVVYTPKAELYHYEGVSRGFKDNINEVLAFKEKYGEYQDPYYNINLSVRDEQFNINPDCSLEYRGNAIERNILFATHNLNLEGAPLHVYEIVKGLVNKDKEYKIHVISPMDGILRQAYEELGVKVEIVSFNVQLALDKALYLNGIEEIKDIIRKNNIQLIYANTLEMFYMVDVGKELEIPAIWNIHESANYKEYFRGADPYVNSRYMNAFIHARKVVFVCNSTLEMYQDMNKANNFDFIYNGINREELEAYKKRISKEQARKELKIVDNEKVILIIGTVCERKGQLDLVKAVKQLKDNGNDKFRVYIVGCRETDYLRQIKQYKEQHQLNNVYLIDETKDVNLYYRMADIFVCASYNESFPRVTLEAMCFELPIVTTPVFGLKEQVINDINGLYFEPGDTEKLCENLEKILCSENVYNNMKENSLKVLSMINSHEEMIRKYESIIDKNLI